MARFKRLAAAAADRLPLLIDLYRFAVQPRWTAANWRDYLETRRKIGWLRDLPEPAAGAPRALFVLRREDVFDVKSNLMLAAALKLEGVCPVVLANHRRVPRIRRYATAFGIDSLHYRSEHADGGSEHPEVARLLRAADDFATVKAWRYRGYPLGERALSTLIRTTLDGDPNPTSLPVRRQLREIVHQCLVNYDQAEAILDAADPRWVMASETGYAANGPLADVAISRGLDVLEASPYLRDGALLLKRNNLEHGRAVATSVSLNSLERIECTAWTEAEDAEVDAEIAGRYSGDSSLQRMYQWNTSRADRDGIRRTFGLDDDRPIVVVFSHVLWDASFFYGDDLFLHYSEWLEQTVRHAVANRRVNWLIKTHPANAFRLAHGDVRGPVAEVELVRRAIPELPEHVRLVLPETDVSSLSLYRHADLGVTVRGTAGLEMACLGKPVLTAGSSHYSGLGFTIDCDSPEQYLERLARAETLIEPPPPQATERARRYTHTLLRRRPWVCRSFDLRLDYPDEGWHPLDRNVLPRARSLAEAEAHGDLHAWAAWAVRSRDADFLTEEAM